MDKTEKMYRVVEAWQRSGIGKQKYAEKIGIGYSALQYWCKKYREQHTSTALQHVAEFVPITVTEPTTTIDQLYTVVITLASGTWIELR